jgi:hypothetical protein
MTPESVNQVGRLRLIIGPANWRVNQWAMESPRPAPMPGHVVVKNGSVAGGRLLISALEDTVGSGATDFSLPRQAWHLVHSRLY